jgi:hypothetical protein
MSSNNPQKKDGKTPTFFFHLLSGLNNTGKDLAFFCRVPSRTSQKKVATSIEQSLVLIHDGIVSLNAPWMWMPYYYLCGLINLSLSKQQ